MSRRIEAIAALAWADVLERVRRYSFLVTLGFVLWLGAGTFDGTVSVSIGETQGAINAAWVGGMMTVVATSFLSLIGFWIVKNAVARDERTGVGAILATTPLSRLEYTLGKATSHFLVLGAMVAILALCGIALLLMQGGGANGTGSGFDLVAFLSPFLICGVPAFALVAALAILFETTPGLRGGAANALWLFGWTALIMLSAETKSPLLDPFGILIIQKSMAAAAHAQLGVDPSNFSIQLNPGMAQAVPPRFLWTGVTWTAEILASRALWLLVAAGIAALAAVPFHRFDPSRRRAQRAQPKAGRAEGSTVAAARRPRFAPRDWLPRGMVGSELRLLLGGSNRWWALVALGLILAGWLAPLPAAKSGVLLAAWIWPLLVWSQLGGRDARFGTEAFILSAPGSLTRQLPAAWAAGVLLTAAMGSGVGARLAIAGDGAGFAAWAAATLFIPALALALGLVSRGNKLFEVIYMILWYAGPLNRTPPIDFMGVTGQSQPGVWFALAAACLAVAFGVRARQLRG